MIQVITPAEANMLVQKNTERQERLREKRFEEDIIRVNSEISRTIGLQRTITVYLESSPYAPVMQAVQDAGWTVESEMHSIKIWLVPRPKHWWKRFWD